MSRIGRLREGCRCNGMEFCDCLSWELVNDLLDLVEKQHAALESASALLFGGNEASGPIRDALALYRDFNEGGSDEG